MTTSKLLQCSAVIIAFFAVVSVGLTRPKSQEGENACDNAYDVCYNNCKGKADVCYSNCDTVYLHCLKGANVIAANANAPLKSHPVNPTPTPRIGASLHPVLGGTATTKQQTQSKTSPTPTPAHNKHNKG
jgi:hypothetical protein